MSASVWKFATEFEIVAKIIELIRPELKVSARDFQRIHGFAWRWRRQPVGYKACISLLDIKGIPVVSDKNIGLIEKLPELDCESLIALLVLLVGGEIGKRDGMDFLFVGKLEGEGKNIPITVSVD